MAAKKMNLFAKAASAPKAVEPPKASKSKKPEVQVAGLKEYAELDALIKAATTLRETVGADIKNQIMGAAVDSMSEGRRPESFRGVEDIASASCEIRKRSTMSQLTADHVALLASFGFEIEKIDPDCKMVAQAKMFRINPKYENDMALLEKVSARIEKIVPEDFIEQTEEKSKIVVTDKVIDAVVTGKCADPTVAEVLFVPAIKAKLEVTNIAEIVDGLKERLSEVADQLKDEAKAA